MTNEILLPIAPKERDFLAPSGTRGINENENHPSAGPRSPFGNDYIVPARYDGNKVEIIRNTPSAK